MCCELLRTHIHTLHVLYQAFYEYETFLAEAACYQSIMIQALRSQYGNRRYTMMLVYSTAGGLKKWIQITISGLCQVIIKVKGTTGF